MVEPMVKKLLFEHTQFYLFHVQLFLRCSGIQTNLDTLEPHQKN